MEMFTGQFTLVRLIRKFEAERVIVLFSSGVMASSKTMFGPAIEDEWNPFTAKMIQRSNAVFTPIRFQGQNLRWYQIANQIWGPLRHGLLLYEVVHALNKSQAPVAGALIERSELTK